MKSKIFRAVVCLLVVCCLVFNASAPRAQATGVELIVGTALSVAAVVAVGSLLVGLGVSPGSDQTVFDDLVNGAVDMLTEAGKVVGGMLSIWSLANSGIKYGVEPEIIEMLRDWLFDSGAVISGVQAESGCLFYNGYQFPVIPSGGYSFKFIYSDGSRSYLYTFTANDSYVIDTGTYRIIDVDEVWHQYFYRYSSDSWVYHDHAYNLNPGLYGGIKLSYILWSNHDIVDAFGNVVFPASEPTEVSPTTVADGLDAGYIAPSTDALTDGYADWAANSITLPGSEADEKDRVLWPMGLGPDYLGTISKPQSDIWDGTSEYTIPDAVTGITISSPDTVTTGGYITIQADVIGTGDYDMLCSCTVTGATSANTKISAMEYENLWALNCGADEKAEALTITVTSVADPAISVTKSIAVTVSDVGTDTDTDATTGTYTGILDTISGAVGRVAEWCSVLVDEVVEIPNKILEGVKSLFIPDAAIMAAQQEKWIELLEDRFGGMYESGIVIHNLAAAFAEQEAQTTIIFPRVEIPLGDVKWIMGAWEVPVVPVGFESFVAALKKMIDLICTLGFLNAMKTRFERVLEGFE